MPDEPGTTIPKARPITGGILGVVAGLAAAVVLQQQGLWPLDKLTVFLFPGIVGLIGVLLTKLGRAAATASLTTMLVLLVAMVAWGATGIADIDEFGELNGGCQVIADSDLDSTTVVDSSRRNPFLIDPQGGLSWAAMSPVVFMDYDWQMWVDLGGAQVELDSDHEDNEGGSVVNADDVPNITEYAEARGIPIDQMRGVYKVGGFAATCDGFGFVEIVSEPLETLAAKIAAGVGGLALILLLVAALTGRGGPRIEA
ncbi:MAG: hypothetical protein L0Z63_09960 [Actinobacteria bacterium]|nr:hypothetical protein [Actinomycetota bacterium]